MAFDINAFRENFPDFSSTTTYPDSMLTYWGAIALALHSYGVFTDLYDHVTSLYVAHKSILQAGNIAESAGNAVPNQVSGALTGATVGNVTTNYASSQASTFKSSGDFVETVYGRQYLDLLNMYCNTGVVW
jgi:hypothetical protein